MSGKEQDYWQDKVAVVTGGSHGFGRVLAKTLAARGAGIAICGRREDLLRDAARELASVTKSRQYSEPLAIQADVTSAEQVEEFFRRVQEHFGRLDLLVNNAGSSARGLVSETPVEEIARLFDLNCLGTIRCTQAALPSLLESRGHLVQIGSLAAKTASRNLGAYPITKFAVAAYSQQLRLELNEKGVHVLLVCPGPIQKRPSSESSTAPEGTNAAKKGAPGGGVRLRGIPPEKLARKILRACEKRQPELIIPGRARLLFTLQQIVPSWGDWIVNRMTRSSP